MELALHAKLTWASHISSIVQKVKLQLKQLEFILTSNIPIKLKFICIKVYMSIMRPTWLHDGGILGSAAPSQIKRIQTLQNRICL